MKLCSKCDKYKELKDFYKFKQSKDGLQSWCKKCHGEWHSTYIKYNRKLVGEHSKKSRKKKYWSEESVKKRAEIKTAKQEIKNATKEQRLVEAKRKISEYGKLYRRTKKEKYAFYTARRHAEKQQRTPKWLTSVDFEKIQRFYDKASKLTKDTGIKHEVDHIIPLKGKIVSGLHVPWNLQVITKAENNKKLNKFNY